MPAQTPIARLRLVLLALGLGSIPTPAKPTTLMFLVDWFANQQMDTLINLKVYQASGEIRMVDGSAVPVPQRTTAYSSQKFATWWALPGFDASLYVQSRIRLLNTYTRGWFQNDNHYNTVHDTTAILPTGTLQFQYLDPVTQKDSIVYPDSTGLVHFRTHHDTATPALHTTPGNGGTAILNFQKLNSKGTDSTGTGDLDHCIDSLRTDTVWIRFLPANQSNPSSAGMRCSGTNPFHLTTSALRPWARPRPPSPIQLRSGALLFLPAPGRDVLGKGSAR